jgi:hypothetical protein
MSDQIEVTQIDSNWNCSQRSDADVREFRISHTEVIVVSGGPELSADAAIEAAMGGER